MKKTQELKMMKVTEKILDLKFAKKLFPKLTAFIFLSRGSSVAIIIISRITWSQLGTGQAVPSSPLFRRTRNKIMTRCDEFAQKFALVNLLSNNFSL